MENYIYDPMKKITILHNGNLFSQVKYTEKTHKMVQNIFKSRGYKWENGWSIAINEYSGKMIAEFGEEFLDMKYLYGESEGE